MIRDVALYPDPLLSTPARALEPGEDVAGVVGDLVDTMRAAGHSVGVAAPQIGELVRVCVVDCTGHRKAPDAQGLLVLVNPVISEASGDELGREGCMSLPDLTANVRRATRVVVEGFDAGWAPLRVEATGFEARALQHEIDHLDGVMFLDRVASLSDDVFRRKAS